MSNELMELVTAQSKKLDEHLAHLRKSLHDTNDTLQGVIGSVQLTRQDITHHNELNGERLEAIRASVVLLQKELDDMDVEIAKFGDTKRKVDTMYSAYNILHKAVLTAIAAGILYATILITKLKTGL